MNDSFRTAAPDALAAALRDARAHTLALFECLAAAGLDDAARVPVLAIVNPPLWELGHVAWFAEWYVVREARSSAPDAAQQPSLLPRADAWFDSNAVPHDARWTLDLPPARRLEAYGDAVLAGVLDRLAQAGSGDAALYPYRLVLAHEDMHGEAFAYTLQTLGVAPPARLRPQLLSTDGTIDVAGGCVELGSRRTEGFVFDNEKWAHPCTVAPFRIDASLVSNARFCEFVEAGGYRDPRCWTPAGQAWLAQSGLDAPQGWRHAGGGWLCRRFGKDVPLPEHEPVRHVCLHEAQAYCNWAGRRLPTEAEWVQAAQSGGPAFRWGDLWEWTGSPFAPYPGFAADVYREYSAPWFFTHQVVRGASFATPPRMRSLRFRNFYAPHRNDIFAGFRTCAPQEPARPGPHSN